MSELENQKNQELEMTKLTLTDTKQMLLETQRKIQEMQNELEAGIAQHQKKIKNLSNIQATQSLKVAKLNSELKNAEDVLNSRVMEHQVLVGLNSEHEAALLALQRETLVMLEESQRRCEELEEEVKHKYTDIQTEKDMEMLLDISVNILKDPAKLPLVLDVLLKKKELITQRRQDQSKEISHLENAQNKISAEIASKQELLAQLKEKNAQLSQQYVRITKIGKGR